MDRRTFHDRFLAAAARARDFARSYVEEALPEDIRFRVRLNRSYDGNPLHADEVVFRGEGSPRIQARLVELAADDASSLLWRDGRVPEWINLSVIGETGAATLVAVDSCGRFTANEELLYHKREGLPPFHVLGPTLPVGWKEGDTFSLYHRAYCASHESLSRAALHAAKVWCLELSGAWLSDSELARIPGFPGLEILEMDWSGINGPGFAGLEHLPSLRVLRATALHARQIDLSCMPRCNALSEISLQGRFRELTGMLNLFGAAPGIQDLTIEVANEVVLDGPIPPLRRFSFSASDIPVFKLPKAQQLSIGIRRATDADVLEMIGTNSQLESLWLRRTPVTDCFLSEVDRWKALKFLDVVDTKVTEAAVRNLNARRPDLRVLPDLRRRGMANPSGGRREGLIDKILRYLGVRGR